MQQLNKKHSPIALTIIAVVIYLICSFATVTSHLAEIFMHIPALYFLAGLTGRALSVLSLCCILSVYKKIGYIVAFMPSAISLLSGLTGSDIYHCLYSTLDTLCVAALAIIIYIALRDNWGKAWACALGGFVMSLCDLGGYALAVLSVAKARGARFGTVLFEAADNTIVGVIEAYDYIAESGIYAAAPKLDPDMMYAAMALVISLSPAIFYFLSFIFTFVVCSIQNSINKLARLIPERAFGEYTIKGITYGIFSVASTITVLSLVFGTGIGSMTVGVFSVTIALVPHFVIMGYRKLYNTMKGLTGVFGGILLCTVLSGFLLAISPLIFFLVITFFGSSEYRASVIKRMTK